ncbi:unnamed protein product [Chrysoparadoxa australica]
MNDNDDIWPAIEQALRTALGESFRLGEAQPVSGASMDRAYRVTTTGGTLFLKIGRPEREADFAAEAAGLRELGQAHGLRVPGVLARGRAGPAAFLAIEHLPLRPLDAEAMTALGEGLAELHGIAAPRFGWDRDNSIGTTPQRNARTGQWLEFWRENRLGYQLELAAERGNRELARAGDRLLATLPDLLAGHRPEASLLHGDLWGGNAAMDDAGRPVIFDPAVYYGDRETDLAMTELFGGFSPLFFEAYHGAWPLEAGYREIRRDLYQLYHLLNHDALFGGHYAAESQRVIERLLAKG